MAMDEMKRAQRHLTLGPFPARWYDHERGEYVDPPHDVGRCWLWRGRTDEKGYGRYQYAGKLMQAHRAIWLLAGRELDERDHLDHCCLVKPCCNPKHLQAVTPGENNRRLRLL